MSQEEENYVALFIDWDNLAISTSVDFGGAVPDVRAIVHAAQRFGTVLLARAYAEWNVSSDRLSVYRAGVEPVYAPTFRFEPEPGSQMPRGKSLADPCLVTDSIDIMHLMPNINVFCLVSGDKDLIPIVRLAQLRGKKVVVIGPDFVAAILREMADEYIPYRGLVEAAEVASAPEVAAPSRHGRRLGGGNSRQPQLVTGHAARGSGQHQSRSSATPPVSRPAVEQNGAEAVAAPPPAPVAPVTSVAPTPELVAEVVPAEETLETGPLFETIRTILREREQAGKPRLRATNLKDQLLARIPQFNERKYGFVRFKDLLTAAEKAGVLNVSRTGPVQWVTLAGEAAPAETAAQSTPPIEAPAASVVTASAEPAPVLPSAEESAPTVEEPIDEEAIRFILDLRERSRWLTYTYVLTNLLNHLGKGSADAAADVAARSLLNRLVQSGILVVDREPHEIDVNGTKHRVRLCHVVDEHPAVAELLAEVKTEGPAPTEVAASEAAPSSLSRPPATPLLAAPAAETAPPEPAITEVILAPAAEAEEPAPAESAPASVEAEMAAASPAAELPTIAAGADAEEMVLESAPVGEAATALAETAPAEAESATAVSGAMANGTVPNAPLTLPQSYEVLREVVREATGPNRPHTGPAAVKNRLVRRLGAFDEHAFGFSKFKDYLLAAEKAGAVKVEVVGTSARVSLPEG